jgi:hypothetical protein
VAVGLLPYLYILGVLMKKLIFSFLVATSFLYAGSSSCNENVLVGSSNSFVKADVLDFGALEVKWKDLGMVERGLVDSIVRYKSTMSVVINGNQGVLISTHSLPSNMYEALFKGGVISNSTKFIFVAGYKW